MTVRMGVFVKGTRLTHAIRSGVKFIIFAAACSKSFLFGANAEKSTGGGLLGIGNGIEICGLNGVANGLLDSLVLLSGMEKSMLEKAFAPG